MTGGGPLLKPVSMYSRPPPLLPPLTPCVQGRTQPHFLSPRGARACFLEAVLTFFLALCSACSWCEACCRHRASSLCSCLSGCAPRLTLRAAGGRPTSGLCRRCLPASEGKAGKRFESWHRKKKTTHWKLPLQTVQEGAIWEADSQYVFLPELEDITTDKAADFRKEPCCTNPLRPSVKPEWHAAPSEARSGRPLGAAAGGEATGSHAATGWFQGGRKCPR